MSSIDAYDKEEKLLSNRSKLSRNIFFALSTSRAQATALTKSGETNTSELDFVEKPPKHTPRNVYIGRSMERWGAQGTRQGPSARTIHDDEVVVQKLKMKLEEQAEENKPIEEKPEEVQKRNQSTLGHPGVSFSRVSRFGSDSYPNSRPGSASNRNSARMEFGLIKLESGRGGAGANKLLSRPGSAANLSTASNNSGTGLNQQQQHENNVMTGRSSSRLYSRTEKELIREAEKENEIERQRELALHPTRFVKQEIRERRKQVAEMCQRPSFGLPPPRPSSANNLLSSPSTSARRGSYSPHHENDINNSPEKKEKDLPPTDSTLPIPPDPPPSQLPSSPPHNHL